MPNIHSENEIAEILQNWYSQVNKNTSHFWLRNPVASKIKDIVEQNKHWKRHPRGNSYQGGKMRSYQKAVEEKGYDGPPPFKPKSPKAQFYQKVEIDW